MDCCIREIGQISFTHAPPSMSQHAAYARMTPEMARAAIRLHGWPQRPPPRALEIAPCACEQVLSSTFGLAVGEIEDRIQKEQHPRRCESGGCDRHARRLGRAMCLLLSGFVVVDHNYHFHSMFRVFPVPHDPYAGGCRKNHAKILSWPKLRCHFRSVRI